MNIHTYSKEIKQAKASVKQLRDFADTLRSTQRESSDMEDVQDSENDATRLQLAADIIENTLPTFPE